jgi:hypothetical protein
VAIVTEKQSSFGNDTATITVTKDTTLGVYTAVTVTCLSGTLTVTVSLPGLPTLTQTFTKAGPLLVPSSNYLLATAKVEGVWVP